MSDSNNHGHTPAAWVTASIVIVGSIISGVAFPIANVTLAIIGFAVIALGCIVGAVLKSAGLGKKLGK